MLTDILEEHRDEAAALFDGRLYALSDVELDRADLAELDGRIRAHLDGLALGGPAAWELARAALDGGTPGDAFVPLYLALRAGRAEQLGDLVELAHGAYEDALEGLRWACRLGPSPATDERLAGWLREGPDAGRALALDALTHRGTDVSAAWTELPAGPRLLRRSALRSARRGHRDDLVEALATEIRGGPESLRSEALETLAHIHRARARAAALAVLEEEDLDAAAGATAAEVLGALGEPADREHLERRAADDGGPALVRASILALGNLGLPASLPTLSALLDDPHRAGTAAAALARIAGIECLADVDDVGLPTFDDDELPWRDDDVPRPSRAGVEDWLARQGARFGPDVRHRHGSPLEPGAPPAAGPPAASPLAFLRMELLEERWADDPPPHSHVDSIWF